MEGIWLASYLALWFMVLFEGVLVFILFRELGVRILHTSSGAMRDGIALGETAPRLGTTAGALAPSAAHSWSLIVFGSSRCEPCRAIASDLRQFAVDHRARLSVYFVTAESQDSAEETGRELGLGHPVQMVGDRKGADLYRVRVTPFAFVVDEDGTVIGKGLASSRGGLGWLLSEAERVHDRQHRTAKTGLIDMANPRRETSLKEGR